MGRSAITKVHLYPLEIPMRRSVTHTASTRSVADPSVLAVELMSGHVGYGETLPRPYVTGETRESVEAAIEQIYIPVLLEASPERFTDVFELAESLPWTDRNDSPCPAARAAVELALLDAYSRHFQTSLEPLPGWMGLSGFGVPGSARRVRYSVVLAGGGVNAALRTLRLARLYGIKDFKLKVGGDDDVELAQRIGRRLADKLRRQRLTLRLDANGAWDLDRASEELARWTGVSIAAVEQPLAKGDEGSLPALKKRCPVPIMHDESLVTLDDARRLYDAGVADAFNIRISKCGGLLPSLRLAQFALRHGTIVQLGCMVGETGILSAVGRRFLELVPRVSFAEGNFGRRLLSDDITVRPVCFGYGGRWKSLPGVGWGVDVDPAKLRRYCPEGSWVFPL